MAPQREWFEKDYYEVLGVSETRDRRRRSPRRTGSSRGSTTPTPTRATPRPRSASRRSRPPTTCSATPRSARSTTRSAGSARWRRASAPAGGVGRPGGAAASRSTSATSATSATCSATCSAAVAAAAAPAAAGRRARSAAATSRPSCTSPSTTPSQGVTTTVHLTSDAACSTCHGIGAEPGHHADDLPDVPRAAACIDDNQGLFSFSQPCPTCGGRGVVDRRPVPDLPGHAASSAGPREVKVRIPAGVDDGQRIRLKGRGAPGPQRRPARRPLRRSCTSRPTRSSAAAARRPHGDRAGHVPRGRARRRRSRCRRSTAAGHAARSRRAPAGTTVPRARARGVAARQGRPATCSSPSRSRCRPKLDRRAERKAVEALAAALDRVTRASTWGCDGDGSTSHSRRPGASTSSRSPPSSPGVHPQTLRIYERKGLRRPGPHRRAAAAATATTTSSCCGASRS